MSHTPGPWAIHGENIDGLLLIGPKDKPNNTGRIAKVDWGICGKDSPEWKANAELIADTPDLLDFVERWFIHTCTQNQGKEIRQHPEGSFGWKAFNILKKHRPQFFEGKTILPK